MTVSTDYYGKEGILLEAMRAGNVEAMKIMLKRGASPHAFQDLFLTSYPITRFVFPLEFIATDDRLDVERKKDLANAFLEAGAIVPKLFLAGGLGPGPELYEAKHLQEQLASQLGLKPPTSPTICERQPNRVCTGAKTRTGVDWCGAIAAMPKLLEHNYKDGSSVPIYTVQLLYLLTIEDNKAYFLASESGYSDYVLVETPKDASSWTVMRFMEPEYGMGLCRQDSGESFRADRCWRRLSLNRVSGSDEMTSELWGQKWRLTSPTCSQ